MIHCNIIRQITVYIDFNRDYRIENIVSIYCNKRLKFD